MQWQVRQLYTVGRLAADRSNLCHKPKRMSRTATTHADLLFRYQTGRQKYRHAPHNDVSVNDGSHIGRWSLKIILYFWRSQWPRGLRRRSAAVRLLRLWVRIPPVASMNVVSVVFCQVEVSATSRSLVHRSSTECDASLCVIQKPQERGHGPRWAAAPQEKKL